MKCWICFEKTNNICCNCQNEYKYAHNYCINILSIIYDKKKCAFCNKKYNINYIFYIFYNLYLFINFILKYDLENGMRWEDYD